MIKALAGNVLFLGLSDENVKRLTSYEPIKFNLKDLGLIDLHVAIFHGKTEEDMKKAFIDAGLIHPTKTIMRDDSNSTKS